MENTREYIAVLDQAAPNNRGSEFWFSKQVRRLTPEQAAPLLEAGKIEEHNPTPRRMVEITHADGKRETLTWGAYLKYRKSFRG